MMKAVFMFWALALGSTSAIIFGKTANLIFRLSFLFKRTFFYKNWTLFDAEKRPKSNNTPIDTIHLRLRFTCNRLHAFFFFYKNNFIRTTRFKLGPKLRKT